jgi:hypothetical protein
LIFFSAGLIEIGFILNQRAGRVLLFSPCSISLLLLVLIMLEYPVSKGKVCGRDKKGLQFYK